MEFTFWPTLVFFFTVYRYVISDVIPELDRLITRNTKSGRVAAKPAEFQHPHLA